MPFGMRTAGKAAGQAGGTPRLVTTPGSAVAAPVGQSFVANGRDTEARRSAPAAAGSGTATCQFGPIPTNEVWQVERITVGTNSSSPSTCKVYLGSIDPANVVDQTPNGDSDIADEVNPILVPGGASLIFVWTGVSNGAEAVARIQYESGTYQQTQFYGG